jgi:ferrous iron transport protein B
MMAAAGLSGRSFIPLLSSFACAIPGIMATRSIQDPRDRLATILVAPLMTCSARLPVYALLIGAFIPQKTVLGVFNQQGLVLFGLYAAGMVSALLVAWTMKRWRRDRHEHPLMLELPSYRLPNPRDLMIGLWERAVIFLKRVGGIILALTILLWFLLSFPAPPGAPRCRPSTTAWPADRPCAGFRVRAARLQLADLHRADPGPGRARGGGGVAGHGVCAVGGRRRCRRAGLSPLIHDGWSLATALSLLVWYIYADVHLHAGHDPARDQFVEADRNRGWLPVRHGLSGFDVDLPDRFAAGGA